MQELINICCLFFTRIIQERENYFKVQHEEQARSQDSSDSII